jgi:hypothetical protein
MGDVLLSLLLLAGNPENVNNATLSYKLYHKKEELSS